MPKHQPPTRKANTMSEETESVTEAVEARNAAIREMTAMARALGEAQGKLIAAADAMKPLARYYTEAQKTWGEAYVELAPFTGKSGLRQSITGDQLEYLATVYRSITSTEKA